MMRSIRYINLLLPLLASIFILNGCGYHLSGDTGMARRLPDSKVAINMFANKSYRPNLEVILTRSLHDEFGRSGVVRTGAQVGELLLGGVVTSFTTQPISYSAADRIREYRITLTAEATLRETPTGKVIWKGSRQASREYPTSSDAALQQNSEAAAVEAACRNLARQIYQAVTEDF